MFTQLPEDRRRWPRHQVSMPIEIGEVRGTTRNVGMNGACFSSPVAFGLGNVISFAISMVDGYAGLPMRLECRGVVTREVPDGNGGFEIAVTMDDVRLAPIAR